MVLHSPKPSWKTSAKIVTIYMLFGLCWIYGSDTLLGWLVKDAALMVQIAVLKGFLYILCTAILLYFLINRFVNSLIAAENARMESLRSYQEVFNATNEAIFVHESQTGKIIDVNDRMLEMFGYSRDEALTIDIGHMSVGIPPYSHVEVVEKVRKAMFEGPQVFEWQCKRKNGELFWSEISLRRIIIHDNDRVIAVVRDITERISIEAEKDRLESQLQQAQKMESVGRLAGGVAHDFNNMLTVILGHAELGLMNLDSANAVCLDLQEITRTAQRSAEMIRQLLVFARRQTIAPKVINLNEIVTEMLKMLQRLLGENLLLSWQPAAKLWQVRMDPSQIDQILANLCVNARDAINGNGHISIKTSNVMIDEEYCAANLEATPGDYVCLTVTDSGRGMDKETQSHIFEPFYTTKEIGKGTGLGLSTVYGAVKQNNGFISIESELDRGTVFSIYLPRYESNTDSQTLPEEVRKPAPCGDETLLLVEDDPAILEIASSILENQGYRVLKTDTPAEALQIAREHSEDIRLLITDVIMPEMNGRDLYISLLKISPELKCLFMSGYTADVVATFGVPQDGVNFIQKPFSLYDISIKVRTMLDTWAGKPL